MRASATGAKRIALAAAFHAGFFRLVQYSRGEDAVILVFHRFSGDGEGDPQGVPMRLFSQCMEYLVRYYRVAPLGELADGFRRGVMRPNTAVVTVDDGYHEVFSLAAPVLRRYAIPASFFVVSDFVDGRLWLWTDRFRYTFERAPRGTVAFTHRGMTCVLEIRDECDRWRAEERWRQYAKGISPSEREELLHAIAEACGIRIPVSVPPQYRPLSWAQLRALAAEGFDVGSHARTHALLSRVAPDQLEEEIAGSKAHIERHIGRPVRHFAYPNGGRVDYTPEAVRAVARAGYAAAVTTIAGGNTPETSIFELRRIAPPPNDLAHFAQSVSGFELLKEQLRRHVGAWSRGAAARRATAR